MLRASVGPVTVKEHRNSSVTAYPVVRLAREPCIKAVADGDPPTIQTADRRVGPLRRTARIPVAGGRTEQNVFVIVGVRFQGIEPLDPATLTVFPLPVLGHPAVIVAHIHGGYHTPLTQIGLTDHRFGLIPHPPQRRQQHGH